MTSPSISNKWEELPSANWMDAGKCKGMDPDTFFPHNGHNLLTRPAIEACNSCPVQLQCLAYAIDNHIDHGIWGGTSERERRRIRSAQKSSLRLAPGPPSPPSSLHG